MSKKDKKFNLLLDGFLRSDLAQGMNPEELEDMLKTLDGKGDSHMTEVGLMKLSSLARNCEKNLRMFKVVVEDMVSVLISAYKNGCLDSMIEQASQAKGKDVRVHDSAGEVDISKMSERDADRLRRREKHGAKLFTESGMKKFLSFVEEEVGHTYVDIWENVDFLNHMIEAMVLFEKSTPEEMQKAMKLSLAKERKMTDVPSPINIDKEVLN